MAPPAAPTEVAPPTAAVVAKVPVIANDYKPAKMLPAATLPTEA